MPKYVPNDSVEQLNEKMPTSSAADAVDAYGMKLQLVEGSTAAVTAALKSAVDR
ncbi:hypothetical protein [Paracoccus sp. DMF]|uniref:hypothetical protein n=1 Tax=Paracoccus sp. DMF TaxID=400837 RepID=UPI0021E4F3D6|nr:hypothetical protein [Paracoccus sp. DMF]MCV2445862.1 hypothetical protein [Paracoccus sp. DMF]